MKCDSFRHSLAIGASEIRHHMVKESEPSSRSLNCGACTWNVTIDTEMAGAEEHPVPSNAAVEVVGSSVAAVVEAAAGTQVEHPFLLYLQLSEPHHRGIVLVFLWVFSSSSCNRISDPCHRNANSSHRNTYPCIYICSGNIKKSLYWDQLEVLAHFWELRDLCAWKGVLGHGIPRLTSAPQHISEIKYPRPGPIQSFHKTQKTFINVASE